MTKNLDVDEHNEAALDAVAESINTGKPLMLVGPVGTGKTTLLATMARAFWHQDVRAGRWSLSRSDRPYQTWLDEPFFFTEAAAFVADVRALWGRRLDIACGLEPFYAPEGIGGRCYRLFLDDLGIEPTTDSTGQIITTLLYERDRRGLPTWISTNLTERDFRERYGSRCWDRLRASTPSVALLGPSRRIAV